MARQLIILFLSLLLSSPVFAQQPYIGLGEENEKKSNLDHVKIIQGANRKKELNFERNPVEYIISNFDTKQKNRLQGRDEVIVIPEGRRFPSAQKELVKDRKQLGRKVLKVTYNATDGEVIYRANFKKSKKLNRFNAIGFFIKGTTSRVEILLKTEDQSYLYDFDAMNSEWQELMIPFDAFEGFSLDQRDEIVGIELKINGIEREINDLEGEFYLDDLKVMKLHPDDFSRLHAYVENLRYQPPEHIVKLLYNERKPF